MDLIGSGIYPLQQAARLVGAQPRAIRRWLQGYSRKYKGERVRLDPLWQTEFADEDLPGEVIGFKDLLELRMVAAFSRQGVDIKIIRATVEAARNEYGVDYPLTLKRFQSDGKRIFAEAVAQSGEPHLIDVLKRQHVISQIIKPSLFAGIEYKGDDVRRWFPMGNRNKAVVLDPALQFGTPALADVGIPTDTIYASYLAEGRDEKAVARIFDISPRLVGSAVRFEQQLAA